LFIIPFSATPPEMSCSVTVISKVMLSSGQGPGIQLSDF
jgi:hypothetical protein